MISMRFCWCWTKTLIKSWINSSAYSSVVFVSSWEFLKNKVCEHGNLQESADFDSWCCSSWLFCFWNKQLVHIAEDIFMKPWLFTFHLCSNNSVQTHLGKRQLCSPSRTQWTAGMAEPLSKSDPKPLWSNLMQTRDQSNQQEDSQTRKVNQRLSQRPFPLCWVLCFHTCICWDKLVLI